MRKPQLLSAVGYPSWPTEVVDIEQRYGDAPEARMRVLTSEAFVAAKLAAWADRRAPRDLYDLWALTERGHLNTRAARLYERYGQHTSIARVPFGELPSGEEWCASLGHQGIVEVTPEAAVEVVRAAIAAL